jgi:hypothetical protein
VEPTTTDDREMSLRYAGSCTVCGDDIPRGARAIYSPSSRSVRHVACPGLDRGVAGGSAMREFERRKARDDARVEAQKERVRETFGDGFIGKVATFIAVDDRPRPSTSVWEQGAVGEERVAARLDQLAEVGVVALHDRRIPGSKANIDHLVVTPWGVWVIDAKRYLNKRPDVATEGGIFGIGGVDRLTVGGRKKDELVEGVLWQIEKVRSELGEEPAVRGILCFVEADWPLLGGHFSVRGVRVTWPRRLAKELLQTTPPTVDVTAVSRALAAKFPPA